MSRFAKEAVTQQADFGLSHRILPREIFMLWVDLLLLAIVATVPLRLRFPWGRMCVIVFFSHELYIQSLRLHILLY